jgi:hypothetical protein
MVGVIKNLLKKQIEPEKLISTWKLLWVKIIENLNVKLIKYQF